MAQNTLEEQAKRIRTLDDQWLAAAARRDLDGMMTIYAPDAQELLPDMPPIIGREAIREFYQRLIDQLPRFAHQFQPQEIVVAASADLAVVRGSYQFTPDSLHSDDVQTGKFVGVWRRQAQDWRLAINISNSDGAPRPR